MKNYLKKIALVMAIVIIGSSTSALQPVVDAFSKAVSELAGTQVEFKGWDGRLTVLATGNPTATQTTPPSSLPENKDTTPWDDDDDSSSSSGSTGSGSTSSEDKKDAIEVDADYSGSSSKEFVKGKPYEVDDITIGFSKDSEGFSKNPVLTIKAPDGFTLGSKLEIDGTGALKDAKIKSIKFDAKTGLLTITLEPLKSTVKAGNKLVIKGLTLTASKSAKSGKVVLAVNSAHFNKQEITVGNLLNTNFMNGSISLDSKIIKVGGKTIEMDVLPLNVNNRMLLPVRFFSYAMGIPDGGISWDDATRTVTVQTDKGVVTMVAGDYKITLNGVSTPIDAPMTMDNNRSYLPLRAFESIFDLQLDWNDTTRTVEF